MSIIDVTTATPSILSLVPPLVAALLETGRSSRPRRRRDRSFWRSDTDSERHVDSVGPSFTVMTYNLGNGLADPQRLVAALRESTADLIGLQELETAQAEAIAGGLGDLFPHHVLHSVGFAGKGLLSRYPILEQEQLHFSPDRPDLRTVIDLDGVSLTVIVAHPRPPKVRLTGIAFDEVTTDQIDMLARIAVASAPAVVVGDFNMTVRHARYAHWTAAGLIDAFRAVRRGGATLPVRIGRSVRMKDRLAGFPLRPVVRVDYIWHTAHLVAQAAWVGIDAGSDHLPVLARLALRTGAHAR